MDATSITAYTIMFLKLYIVILLFAVYVWKYNLHNLKLVTFLCLAATTSATLSKKFMFNVCLGGTLFKKCMSHILCINNGV